MKKIYTLCLLVLIFLSPGLVAYWVYHHPEWVRGPKVNKGQLLTPPILMSSMKNADTKWALILWSPTGCDDKSCLPHLEKLAKIRLALGRKLYGVEQWLVTGHDADNLNDDVKALLKEGDFNTVSLSAIESKHLDQKPQFFIASPEHYWVLRYDLHAESEDIYKDLKLLLNTTESKNG